MKKPPIGVTRARAIRILRRFEDVSDYERLRNYEIEDALEVHLQRKFVVAEWCFFDGETCAYRNYASQDEREAFLKRRIEFLRNTDRGEPWRIDMITETILRGKPLELNRSILETP